MYANGNAEIILAQIEGSSQSRAVVSGGMYHERWPTSLSPDGANLAFQSYSGKIGFEVWILPLAVNSAPYRFNPIQDNPARSFANGDPLAFFSPDGKWLAYVSEESGQLELYVAKFPGGRGKQQISNDGALRGFWRHDGREILYVTREKKLVGLPVLDRGDRLEIGKSYPLFANKIIANHDSVDISKDGQRLLMPIPIEEQVAPVTLVTNWTATIER
jgi:Tol biopolymer transport system component